MSPRENEPPLDEAQERLAVIAQWLRKARNDLRTAQHTLTITDDCPFDTVGFHAQQCAEKALKALLAAHGSDVPKTHDLRRLVDTLEKTGHSPVGVTRLDLDVLTDYAVAGRYMDDYEPVDRDEAEAAVAMALAILAAVQAAISVE